MRAEEAAARQIALSTGSVVTRSFSVGWEIHYGYYLRPIDNGDEHILADFADQKVEREVADFAQFGVAFPKGVSHPHLGKRIICDCTGIEWSYHSSPRFIVQSVRMKTDDPTATK